MTDIYAFCSGDPSNCNTSKFLENLTQNMFVLMAKATEMTQIYKAFPAETAEALYEQTYMLGNDVGTLLRVLSGYKQ
jgi:hypothetical protein